MNDATLKQITAAKPMVNNDNAIRTQNHMVLLRRSVLPGVDLRASDDFVRASATLIDLVPQE